VGQENAATKYTNDAVGQFASTGKLANPAEYFHKRSRAVALSFAGEWTAAREMLADLVTAYPDDGDTWYLLGLSSMNTEDWRGAITAFERTIQLGTNLKGAPTGSSPANDIMIKIAEAYAALGDVGNSKIWIENALAARYDERPFLAGNARFEMALSAEELQKVTGDFVDDGLSRDALWRTDLRALESELCRLHIDLHNSLSAAEFEKSINEIDRRIPSLTDQEIIFEFMKLVGALGSGHNFLIPTNGARGSFSRLPVEFYWFSDGLFIVNADQAHQDLIGQQVVKIGGVQIDEVLNMTRALNPRDNEMQHLWLAPYYASLPEALKGLGVIENVSEVTLTLSSADSSDRQVILGGVDWAFTGFPKLPKLKNAGQPRFLERSDELYWMEEVPKQEAVFVQFNWVSEYEDNTLASFSRAMTSKIKQPGVKHLILDVRHNPGGDGSLLAPLVRALIHFDADKPDGKLFVIVGRGTFSAAHKLVSTLSLLTNAIIVGEPSGSRPNAISESGWFRLPHSKLMGLTSSQFHQDSDPEDHRLWIAPQIPVTMSSEDYFNATDPALKAIFAVLGQVSGNENSD
jgi:tetratricopeptide (TPR) repeat protein